MTSDFGRPLRAKFRQRRMKAVFSAMAFYGKAFNHTNITNLYAIRNLADVQGRE
jgi:hypothetical protein